MIKDIIKYQKATKNKYQFCVLIPTWNNLENLKDCVNSILKNSHFDIQVIVMVNQGKDETLAWLESNGEID